MKLLLDTHALIWWLAGHDKLSRQAHDAINDRSNEIIVSAASAMEIATKFRIGKLPEATYLAREFSQVVADQGFSELAISVRHALLAGEMSIPHKNPIDRLIMAQAMLDDLMLVSNEAIFDGFGVRRLW